MRKPLTFMTLLCFLLFYPVSSHAIKNPGGQELFGKHTGSEGDVNPLLEKMKAGNRTVVRSRAAAINFNVMNGDIGRQGGGMPAERLQLSLFPDTIFTAVFDRLEKNRSGSQSWIGHLDGVTMSNVTLVHQNGMMAGNISLPGASYQIRYLKDGIHSIRQIDHSRFPESDDAVIPPKSNATPSPDTSAMKDDGSIVDVMVVYTPSARSAVGGTSAMNTLIDLAISETNTSYQNSGINHRVRLVHRTEVSYTEQSFSADLNNITGASDGYMDNVHSLRNQYGADEVVLLINNASSCGLAWLMTTVSTSFASSAFAVAHHDCATGYYSFGHEIGHNMGARHDRYVDNANTPYITSHGYVNVSAGWRTIMAYNNKCADAGTNCTRVQYWSNPNVTYLGNAMGIASGSTAADNRTTLNNTAFTVANFRDTVVVSTPASLAINGSASVEGGSPSSYTTTVTYTDGTTATVTPTWSISPTANASISTGGVLSTSAVTSAQSVTISASYTANGVTVTASKNVTLTVATPTALSISGSSSVSGGASSTYTATASTSTGGTVTVTPTWSVSPNTNASISASGVLTTTAVTSNQTITITASYTANGATVSATLNVTIVSVPVLTSLAISGSASLNGGSSTTYGATATFNDGSTSSVTPSWSVSPGTNATISSLGVLTTTSVRVAQWVTITASYTSNGVTQTTTKTVKLNPTTLLASLDRRTSIISPYWQTDSGSYSFVSVGHPSLAGMASQIGISVTAVGFDGLAQGTSDFTISPNTISKLFIAGTNNPYINPTTLPSQNLMILGPDPVAGQLRFTPLATNSETVTTSGGNSDGRRLINMLSIWGAVVNQNTNTGFAMEFIGDLSDSRNPVRGAIISSGVN